jgi:hypothetical protein
VISVHTFITVVAIDSFAPTLALYVLRKIRFTVTAVSSIPQELDAADKNMEWQDRLRNLVREIDSYECKWLRSV